MMNMNDYISSIMLIIFIINLIIIQTLSKPYHNYHELLNFNLQNDDTVGIFGNDDTVDYYRLLEVNGNHLIVGAADNVYNLTINKINNKIKIVNSSHYYWPAVEHIAQECRYKAASDDDCRNYIRVLSINSRTGDLLICGTHAYKPKCRIIDPKTNKNIKEFSGTGLSPLDPRHNTTFYLNQDNLYAATVSDFSGSDSLIYRRNISEDTNNGIRTERNNIRLLNKPQFAGSLHTDKYVYFFFREKSIEAESVDGIGAGGYYSRVARVCKNDKGGPMYYANEWTSFIKARLNCSLPGSKPFYFDQIVSISNITGGSSINDNSGGIVYATFVSEYDFLSQSVICAFNLNDIDNLFENSDFLVSDPGNPAYYRKRRDSESQTGKCQKNSRTLTLEQMQFIKSTPLMADLVPNIFSKPVGVYESDDHYNQITVLPNVHLPEHGHRVDVLFVGTDQGNVLKLVNLHGKNVNDKDPMIKISVSKIGNSPIRRLLIFNEQYLIALTDRKLVALPLQQCSRMMTCKQCVESRDPHCGWNIHDKICKSISRSDTTKTFIQDVYNGDSNSCNGFEKIIPMPMIVENRKLNSGSKNDTKPIQGYRKFPHIDCDCSKKDSDCDCSKQSEIRSIDQHSAIKAEPDDNNSIINSTTIITILAILQLLIIIILGYCFYRYKNKQKKLTKKSEHGIIHAYGDPNKSFNTDTLRHSNPPNIPSQYSNNGNYSPPMTTTSGSQYEPFYPITQINIDPGYQSGSLGSKSGSDVTSKLEGLSEPKHRYFSTFSGGSSTTSTSNPGTP